MAAALPSIATPRRLKAGAERIDDIQSPRTGGQTKAHAWSVSFLEASKNNQRKRLEAERISRWTAGNHDSTHFFRKMGESLADTATVKAQCKAAVEASPARHAEEKVSLDHIVRRVDDTKALCKFSRGCIGVDEDLSKQCEELNRQLQKAEDEGEDKTKIQKELSVVSERMQKAGGKKVILEGTAFAPHCLSHLEVPGMGQKQQEAATKVQSLYRGRTTRKLVLETKGTLDKTTIAAGTAPQPDKREEQEPEKPVVAEVHDTHVPPPLLSAPEDSGRRATPSNAESPDVGGTSNFGEDSQHGSRSGSKEPLGSSPKHKSSKSSAGLASDGGSTKKGRKSDAGTSDTASEKSEGDDWPPKPPILRFRAQCQFSQGYKNTAQMELERKQRREEEDRKNLLSKGTEKIDDYNLGWINMFFKMEVESETQFHGAFPLILLTMIDVIYPKKVRWHQVDWNAGYTHALTRNQAVVEQIWKEVNMDKLKDFRMEYTGLCLENALPGDTNEKLLFLKQMRRWFDMRVHYSDAFDPIERRTAIEKQVRMTGRYMKFPSWMLYDKEAIESNRRAKPEKKGYTGTENTTDYDKMPEFKRLIWFLGSADHQSL